MRTYSESNNEHIIETMINDSLSRNKSLLNFVKMIVSNSSNDIIAINGGWGTGKTFFAKQLELLVNFANNFNENGNYVNEYLQTNKLNCLQTLTKEQKERLNQFVKDKKIREVFNSNQTNCLYFNAWEYDDNENPILSIIYKIINDFPYLSANFSEEKEEKFMKMLNAISAYLTKGNLKISDFVEYKNLTKDIITSEELKKHINNILEDLICENCNHLVLIIDELDRCKPTYALKLLENLKHYINNEKISIVLVTNIYQLSNTIKNIYGSKFDIYEYLDKIIDITFTLKPINRKEYMKTLQLESIGSRSNWFSEVLTSYVNYRKLEMRSINRFIKMMSMYENYIYLSKPNRKNIHSLLEYIFLPYYLGEQIFNINNYNNFVSGKGFDEFYKYVSSSDELLYIIDCLIYENIHENKKNHEEDLKKIYDLIYNNVEESHYENMGTEYVNKNDALYFNDLCTMLNDYNFNFSCEKMI